MNYNRRKFLQSAGTLVLSSAVLSSKASSLLQVGPNHPIGVQLFTFFGVIDENVKGTLLSISKIGYKEVESAFSKLGGFYGMKPGAFKAIVNDYGMSWVSHHVLGAPFKLPKGYKMPAGADGKPMVMPVMLNLRDNMSRIIDEAAEGGIKYLVCANSPTGTIAEINSTIKVLNATGIAAKKAGIQFAYHNHDMEFHPVDGKVPYHLLLSETSPENVKMELDLAWAVKGGQNPVELFKKHPGRFPLWHVKDLDAARTVILPVGSGTIDFKPIFAASKIAGMKHFFVEHDGPKDALASVKSSYEYLTGTLKV